MSNLKPPGRVVGFGIWLTQGLNTLLGGWPDESLSSRSYRMAKTKASWRPVQSFINLLFFWQKDSKGQRDHCRRAFYEESLRQHLPLVLRDRVGEE